MASDANVERLMRDLARERSAAANESKKIGPARSRAAQAASEAARASSDSTRRMKEQTRDRYEREANRAETNRAAHEVKAAKIEADLNKERLAVQKQRDRDQSAALARLRRETDQRAQQFRAAQWAPVAGSPVTRGANHSSDVFLSHASEDKDEIARPLRDLLEERGVSVWFDEVRIQPGASNRRAIETGLAGCRFGLVLLTSHFFVKQWTQAELNGLWGRQMGERDGEGLILPVWHKVSLEEVRQHAPSLADLQALNTSIYGLEEIADRVAAIVM